jgi:hypothetical protein
VIGEALPRLRDCRCRHRSALLSGAPSDRGTCCRTCTPACPCQRRLPGKCGSLRRQPLSKKLDLAATRLARSAAGRAARSYPELARSAAIFQGDAAGRTLVFRPIMSMKSFNHLEAYVDGNIHTNVIENVWTCLKRTINGTYVSVKPLPLFHYVDEQAFRYKQPQAPWMTATGSATSFARSSASDSPTITSPGKLRMRRLTHPKYLNAKAGGRAVRKDGP